ncbi:MAG: hypothetical protein M0036_18960 [Desulfobacteraceae bacterium]|nr:hypothetical protein [Desulfobacteraceae bacterium]
MNGAEVIEQTLTDGSKAYNVAWDGLTLNCISLQAAEKLAKTINWTCIGYSVKS